jgi:hypothetical protein
MRIGREGVKQVLPLIVRYYSIPKHMSGRDSILLPEHRAINWLCYCAPRLVKL